MVKNRDLARAGNIEGENKIERVYVVYKKPHKQNAIVEPIRIDIRPNDPLFQRILRRIL